MKLHQPLHLRPVAQKAKVKWLDQLLAEEEDLASQMIFPSSGIRWEGKELSTCQSKIN